MLRDEAVLDFGVREGVNLESNPFDAAGMHQVDRKGENLPSATITDVARHAGVAPSTVSYVLSGNRSIS